MSRKKFFIHIHHISTHFTNGMFPAASAMITLYLFTGNALYESTAFHCIVIGLLSIPLAYGSGIVDWKKRFQGRRTRIFDHKIGYGLLFIVLGLATVFIRVSFEENLLVDGTIKWVYISFTYALTIIATYLGHLGSKFI